MQDSHARGHKNDPKGTSIESPHGEDSDAAADQSSTPASKGCAGQRPCSEEFGRDAHDAVGNPIVTDGGVVRDQTTTDVVDPDLTKFQLRILAILADEARYGLAIKRDLEDYYGEDINHSRLYPNLDTLAEKGYVERSELDKRTNEYALTERGKEVLDEELHWLADKSDLALVDQEGAVEGGAD